MTTSTLTQFIAHARSKGMDHQTIRMLLLSSGWKEKDIVEALTEATLDMPVPAPEDRGAAREAFFHLLAFVTLYASVMSVLVLMFEYLNRLLPDAAFDPTMSYGDDTSSIRWFIATLIVSFPFFAWMSRIINQDIAKNPERAWSLVRRWLTYLTLFVTAGILVGDGITLLYYVLDGEITTRFLLKVLTVSGVAGMVFGYYFVSLKLPPKDPRATSLNRWFGIAAWAVALAVVAWGFVYAGSPMSQRLERLDERRVNDLRAIQEEIYTITYQGVDRYNQPTPITKLPRPLPVSLDQVVKLAQFQRPSIVDPDSGAPYSYDVRGSKFSLCAVFSTEQDNSYNVFWNHPAGEHCFEFDALDPNTK